MLQSSSRGFHAENRFEAGLGLRLERESCTLVVSGGNIELFLLDKKLVPSEIMMLRRVTEGFEAIVHIKI